MCFLQSGPRGKRELAFYETVRDAVRSDSGLADVASEPSGNLSEDEDSDPSSSGRVSEYDHGQRHLPFGVRNAALLRCIPRFCEPLSLGSAFTHQQHFSNWL